MTTLKAPFTTAADDIHKYFSLYFRENKTMFQVNWQRIHIKNQALFSLKDKSKKLKCHLLQFLFGALSVYGKQLLLLESMLSFQNRSFNFWTSIYEAAHLFVYFVDLHIKLGVACQFGKIIVYLNEICNKKHVQ